MISLPTQDNGKYVYACICMHFFKYVFYRTYQIFQEVQKGDVLQGSRIVNTIGESANVHIAYVQIRPAVGDSLDVVDSDPLMKLKTAGGLI